MSRTRTLAAAIIAGLLAMALAGCRPAQTQPSPTVAAGSVAATVPPRPLPSDTPCNPARTPTIAPDLPEPLPAAWTQFLGVNEVNGLAFASSDTLWAATGGGAVRWNLPTGTYTRYGMADGLPADYASSVALAPDGSLWLTTPRGVSHYDGSVWTTYTQQDGLADGTAVAAMVTPEGVVWVGTTNGVSRFDGRTWMSYLPGIRAWSLAVAPSGDIWFANDGAGVSRYTPAQDAWTTYTRETGLPAAGIKAVGVGPGGDVWAYAGYDHVYRFDGQTWQQVYDAGGQWVCGLAFAGQTPWIATCGGYHAYGQGLAFRQGAAWSHVTADQGLPSNDVRSVAVGPGGLVAAGTDRGLAVQQAGTWRVLRGGPLLNQIETVAVTSDGVAWFGFGGDGWPPPSGGVSRFDGQTWQYANEAADVQMLAVAPALPGGTGNTLWAGTGCNILRLDGQQWQVLGDCDVMRGNVLDLAFERGGAVWAATGLGLARYDGQEWTAYDRLIHAVEIAPDGTLWASGWEGTQGSDYVARFDGSEWQTIWDGHLGSLAITPDGQVWGTAGEQGLARFDGQAWTFYTSAGSLPLTAVSAMAVDPAAPDALWLAAGQAIAHFDGQAWSVYSLPPSWTEITIQAMAVANDGSVWLATSRGALRFRPDLK